MRALDRRLGAARLTRRASRGARAPPTHGAGERATLLRSMAASLASDPWDGCNQAGAPCAGGLRRSVTRAAGKTPRSRRFFAVAPVVRVISARRARRQPSLRGAAHTVRMADLAAIEARIWSLLDAYRGSLVESTIYGVPALSWPGAKAHDYFAAVKPAKSYVSLYLVVADAYPEALEDASAELLKRRSGKAAFTFRALDDSLAADLEALLGRLFERYAAAHA